jgi:alkylhydroperoxidase family enzyme
MIFSPAVARIEPLPLSEWPSEMRAALAALDPPVRRHPRPQREGRPKALNALGTLARYPALTHAFHTFNGHVLFATTLSPRQRDLLVLRVAALREASYEWAQHVVQGADAGITPEEMGRVRAGPNAPEWSSEDRALLQATDELVHHAVITDATWEQLVSQLDERQLMDLIFTVGAYDALAMAFKAFGVELDEDLKPYAEQFD